MSPAQDLTEKTLEGVRDIMFAVAQALYISGPFNMQLIAKDDELKVIECNVRASRSFPFVSKALDLELIPIATRIFMGLSEGVPSTLAVGSADYVGVKVAQFSFNRLPGSDPTVGVDMMSTGEVACFGNDRCEAYLKGLISTGFKVPKPGMSVLLSIGTYRAKADFLPCVHLLVELGFKLYGSKGTSEFYTENGIETTYMDLPTDKEQGIAEDSLKDKQFGLVINIPAKSRFRRPASYNTQGYLTRTMAVKHSVPLITDIKCAKLFVEAIYTYGSVPSVNTAKDCRSANRIVTLPGLIDVHVHVREPGAVHKEDWSSCTAAALAGGVTMVCAMPNTNPAMVDKKTFDAVRKLAASKARCDYGVWVGATMNNTEATKIVGEAAVGLSMELDHATCGALQIDDLTVWMAHFESWPSDLPIVVRAESKTLAAVLMMATLYDRAIHVCALSRREEIMLVREAKRRGIKVTCGVSPHHLFLTDEDASRLGADTHGKVHPPLATKVDKQALWDNLGIIDVISSHHAPHTAEEKSGDNAPAGFPGLESMMPLLLTAVHEGKLTIEDLVLRLHTNPRKIFRLPEQPDTYIEVDMDVRWELPSVPRHSKCDWSPFAGQKVVGAISRVVIRGELAFLDGKVLADPGTGEAAVAPAPKVVASSGQVKPSVSAAAGIKSGAHLPDSKAADRRPKHVHVRASRSPSPEGRQPTTPLAADKSPKLLPSSPAKRPLYGEKVVATRPDRGAAWKASPGIMTPDVTPQFHHPSQLLDMRGHSVLSVKQFNRAFLHQLFNLAHDMRMFTQRGPLDMLRGLVMGSIFYEPSTRTSCSFTAAMQVPSPLLELTLLVDLVPVLFQSFLVSLRACLFCSCFTLFISLSASRRYRHQRAGAGQQLCGKGRDLGGLRADFRGLLRCCGAQASRERRSAAGRASHEEAHHQCRGWCWRAPYTSASGYLHDP